MPHRAAQPGVVARQPAAIRLRPGRKNDAVALRQPRFQLAIDTQMRACRFRPDVRDDLQMQSENTRDSRRVRPSGHFCGVLSSATMLSKSSKAFDSASPCGPSRRSHLFSFRDKRHQDVAMKFRKF